MKMKTLLFSVLVLFAASSPAIAAEFPAMPGKRFDVGGYYLHILCMGEGSPTVIVDVGLGDDSTDWRSIQQTVAKNAHICVVDRAGYGWSDFGPSPRSSARIADELAILLEKANLQPPFVLVGHSFGGYNVRLFAANYPDKVAGVILVDASHEDQYNQFQIKLPDSNHRYSSIIISPKPAYSAGPTDKPAALSERAFYAAKAEIIALDKSASQLHRAPTLPAVPLIVISRGKPEWYGGTSLQQREKTWLALQQDLSQLSPISVHMFAHKSGHDIPQQQPEIIVEAIDQIISQVHAHNTL